MRWLCSICFLQTLEALETSTAMESVAWRGCAIPSACEKTASRCLMTTCSTVYCSSRIPSRPSTTTPTRNNNMEIYSKHPTCQTSLLSTLSQRNSQIKARVCSSWDPSSALAPTSPHWWTVCHLWLAIPSSLLHTLLTIINSSLNMELVPTMHKAWIPPACSRSKMTIFNCRSTAA